MAAPRVGVFGTAALGLALVLSQVWRNPRPAARRRPMRRRGQRRDVTAVVATISIAPAPATASDVNGDGAVTIADRHRVILVINAPRDRHADPTATRQPGTPTHPDAPGHGDTNLAVTRHPRSPARPRSRAHRSCRAHRRRRRPRLEPGQSRQRRRARGKTLTVTRTPTITRTPTLTRTATRRDHHVNADGDADADGDDPGAAGPLITFFGLAQADGEALMPPTSWRVPVYVRQASGFPVHHRRRGQAGTSGQPGRTTSNQDPLTLPTDDQADTNSATAASNCATSDHSPTRTAGCRHQTRHVRSGAKPACRAGRQRLRLPVHGARQFEPCTENDFARHT